MELLGQNLRFGLRQLLKSPVYTFIAVLTLALGIGANTALFSVVNAVLLKPLPYLESPRLVTLESGDPQRGVENLGGLAPADFWDLQAQSQSFTQLAAMSGDGGVAVTDGQPEELPGARVTANFFSLFDANPLLGRAFLPEDGLQSAPGTVVLSYRIWQRKFGGDPNIIGKRLDNGTVQVIGVMPPDFKYPDFAETWTPMARDSGEMSLRRARYFNVIGLLKPEQSLAGAQTELQAIAARLAAQYPDSNKNISMAATLLRARMVRDVKLSLLVMMAAVVVVLLIACANVANLLLTRATGRRKELAIRAALGASRKRIAIQLLTESLLLSCTGGVFGLLLALWGKDVLVRLLPVRYSYLQLQDQVQLDATVLAFTALAVVLTGVLFGLLPAWQASRAQVYDILKDGSRGTEGRMQQRTRGALVVTEIALAMLLLIGAGLLINSFVRLQRVNLGFDPQQLLVNHVALPMTKYQDGSARAERVRQIQERVAAVPGVDGVAVTSGGAFPFLQFACNRDGKPLPADERVMYDSISANYFRVLRAQMLAGREFNEFDRNGSLPVVIINEKLAQQFFPGEDPVGKTVLLAYLNQRQRRQIVGVVKNHVQGVQSRIEPQVYVPYTQQSWLSQSLLVRARGDVDTTRADVVRAISELDPGYIATKMDTPVDVLGKALAEPKLYTTLLGTFAALALLLAAVGIYGVISYSVAQRTQELGIRLALGATPRAVLALVLQQGMTLVVFGIGVGLVTAWALTRSLNGLLFGISATDPLTFVLLPCVLLLVSLLACWLPARRATKVDPLVALRYE